MINFYMYSLIQLTYPGYNENSGITLGSSEADVLENLKISLKFSERMWNELEKHVVKVDLHELKKKFKECSLRNQLENSLNARSKSVSEESGPTSSETQTVYNLYLCTSAVVDWNRKHCLQLIDVFDGASEHAAKKKANVEFLETIAAPKTDMALLETSSPNLHILCYKLDLSFLKNQLVRRRKAQLKRKSLDCLADKGHISPGEELTLLLDSVFYNEEELWEEW